VERERKKERERANERQTEREGGGGEREDLYPQTTAMHGTLN